jgi:hypothetical protein
MSLRFESTGQSGSRAARWQDVLRRGVQALVLFFAVAQTATPLLHAHFSDDRAGGDAGIHIHLGVPLPADDHALTSDIRDFAARILSVPDAHVRDEALRVLDLPAFGVPAFPPPQSRPTEAVPRFVCVPSAAPQPFPKPLPLAPPAPA